MSFEERKLGAIVVDANTLVAELVSMFLNRHPSLSPLAEASSGIDGLSQFRKFRPEVVISALELPTMNGVEMLRKIRDVSPDTKVILYSGSSNVDLAYEALDFQPDGLVHITETMAILGAAIDAVVRGMNFCSPYYKVVRERCSANKPFDGLTSREQVVLQLVAEGFSSKQIAYTLSLSNKTIENYRANIMKKLRVNCAVDLAVYAVRRGLVTL